MSDRKGTGEKLIATNPLAHANYFIDETVESGIVLTGTEVKSLRAQAPNIREAFVEVKAKKTGTEAWLVHAHIAPYTHGNIWNHEPLRPRKLLLHRHQIEHMYGAVTQKSLTIIPLRMYFKSGRVKVELGLGRGKKKQDKRHELRKKSAEREMDQAMKHDRVRR